MLTGYLWKSARQVDSVHPGGGAGHPSAVPQVWGDQVHRPGDHPSGKTCIWTMAIDFIL